MAEFGEGMKFAMYQNGKSNSSATACCQKYGKLLKTQPLNIEIVVTPTACTFFEYLS